MSNPIVLIKTTSGPSDVQSINSYNNLRRGELGYDYTNDKLYIGNPNNENLEGKLLNPKDYFSSFTKNNYTLTLTTKDGISYAQTLPDLYVSGWAWADGTINGPTATITIKDANDIITNKTVSVGAIPSASDSASGIVTTGTQQFSGQKTFKGTIISQNIYPENANIYNSGTKNNFWSSVNSSSFKIRDNNSFLSGDFYSNLQGETNLLGQTYLDIGNNIVEGQEGNAQGFLNIYSKNNTFAQIISNTNNSNKIITIPNYTGNMTISKAEDVNPTLLTSYRLPFFAGTYEQLGTNDGYILEVLQGATNSLGQSKLILGNNIKNGVAGNKYGSIQLYGRDDESFTIMSNINTVNEENDITHYTIYLPVSNSATSELLYHDVNTSIGGDSRPVYITKEGKPVPISIQAVSYGGTGTNIAPKQGGIIYGATTSSYASTSAGSKGQLLQSNGTDAPNWLAETIGSINTPVYVSKGVLTPCQKNFDQYLPLTGGILDGPVLFNDIIKFNTESYGTSKPNSGQTGQLYFVEDDGLLITTNYGYGDPTPGTNGYGINGALYFKILEE